MDHQLTAEDVEFVRWVDSKEHEQYWEKDERGEKVILRSGWKKKTKPNMGRVKGLKEKPEND